MLIDVYKKLKKIHGNLKAHYKHMFLNPNYTEIEDVESFLKMYVETNQKEFEYDFFDPIENTEQFFKEFGEYAK